LGQQAPFVPITGPNAPNGACFLLEDHHGGLWLAGAERGAEGLTHFDGTHFVKPTIGFPKIVVTGMAEDAQGGILLASTGGLHRFFKGQLAKLVDGVALNGITKVAGDVFLATISETGQDPLAKTRLLRIVHTQDAWRVETVIESMPGARFLLDRFGSVLYACQGGYCEMQSSDLVRWHPGITLKFDRHPALARFSLGYATAVFRDKFGCVWMRSGLDTSYQCPGDTHFVILPAKVASLGTPALDELEDGSVVIAGLSKLAIGRPGKFRVLTTANGYPSAAYSIVTEDGSIWLSSANGLFVFPSRLQMEFWTERDGLDGNSWSILRIGDKTYAATGDAIRILDRDRSRWRLLTELRDVMQLCPGPNRTIFASSQSDGVVQLSLEGKILRRSKPTTATALTRTSDGRIWVAGSEISSVDIGRSRLDLRPVKLPIVRDGGVEIKADGRRGFWTCYGGGLIHEEPGGSWELISKTDGLIENRCISLAIDQEGGVWCGYSIWPSVFSLIENATGNRPRVRNFTTGEAVGNTQSLFFATDHRGWIWRGTPKGIYIADPEQARKEQWLYINRSDGLPRADANQRSFFEDRDGSSWFGMGNSIVHFSAPDDLVYPRSAPVVFVAGFSQNGGAIQLAETVDKVTSDASFVAHIGSLQRDRRNALRLRYRLLPEQTSWRSGSDLDIRLGRLRWGQHTFEVQARLGTGPWSSTKSKSFQVLTPTLLSWPALVALVAILSGAGVSTYRWQRKQQQLANIALPALAKWRLAVLSPEVQSVEGTILDERFLLEHILARGGFATVFQGKDLHEHNRLCAIKIFRHELVEKSWLNKRFLHEVSALKQICHPNVVEIYGHGTTPSGAPYLVMEFVGGQTLRELLSQRKLRKQTVAMYLRQMADALSEIHARGIYHRDLKPENIMVRSSAPAGQEIVLIDFSIAIVKEPDETLHGLSRAAGTFCYMAPEQVIGYADSASDIYSLTKILIEMVTGHRVSSLLPNASIDLSIRMRQLLTDSMFGFSPASIQSITEALQFDPSQRPKHANEFVRRIAEDLETS
jgi:tRNA A-37 threonylcarbamoyl transferase component Bud32/ligand-binding sensor domain-containing protein